MPFPLSYHPGPRLSRLAIAWLAFSAPLGCSIFYNTRAVVLYVSECLAELLNFFWFFPWLRSAVEYLLLLPYRLLCAVMGGGYTEEAWRKVLEVLLREYTEREREALHVGLLWSICMYVCVYLCMYVLYDAVHGVSRSCLWKQTPPWRRSPTRTGSWPRPGIQTTTPARKQKQSS